MRSSVVAAMTIGRGNRSTRGNTGPVPLCPPKIPRYLTWDQTRGAAVGFFLSQFETSRQLTFSTSLFS
jgi:hypothetical protein